MTKPAYKEKYPHLFSPLTIPIDGGKNRKSITLKNRYVQAPMATSTGDYDGRPMYEAMRFYTDFAKGGFAMVSIPTEVPSWDMHQRVLSVSNEATKSTFVDFHKPQKVIHAYGALSELELVNGGIAYHVPAQGENAVTVSPYEVRPGVFTKEMTEEDMLVLLDAFAEGALVARRAEFNSVGVIASVGCLIQNFLSPKFNHRTDKYGGSIENCCRFPIMILKRIREVIGDDMAIHMRINGCDNVYDDTDGLQPELVAEYIRVLQDYVDYFSIWTGHRITVENRPTGYPTNFMPEAMFADDLRKIRSVLGDDLKVPIGLVGKVHTPELAEQLIAEGTADFIMMARQSIADPDFVKKIIEGREDDIRPCVHCNMCIDGRRRDALNQNKLTEVSTASFDLLCRVNPLYNNGHARKDEIPLPRHSEKVAVIGGGIAGMQAAFTAAERGHNVTLYEKGSELGGQLNQFATKLWFTSDLIRFRDYLKRQMEKNGVKVELNTEVTPEMIDALNYDTVIVAIGSSPVMPPIPGIENDNVKPVIACFGNEAEFGQNVVIIGGGLSGCDAAIHLGEYGHKVTVIEQQGYIAPLGVIATRQDIFRQFAKNGVKSYVNTTCTKLTSEGVYATNSNGEDVFYPADQVLIAVGNRPNSDKADAYLDTARNVRKIGDCKKAEDLINCIHGGYDAGVTIGV